MNVLLRGEWYLLLGTVFRLLHSMAFFCSIEAWLDLCGTYH